MSEAIYQQSDEVIFLNNINNDKTGHTSNVKQSSPETSRILGEIYEIEPTRVLEIHPMADMMPKMSEEEFTSLKESIKNGQEVTLKILDGKLLDGRHRWKACQELGIPACAENVKTEEPFYYVFSGNIARRHLNPGILAAFAVKHKKELCIQKPPKMKTRQFLAQKVGVSEGYIQKALGLQHDKKKLEQVIAGEVSLSKATPQVINAKVFDDAQLIEKLVKFIPEEKNDQLVDISPHCKGKKFEAVRKRAKDHSNEKLKAFSEKLQKEGIK